LRQICNIKLDKDKAILPISYFGPIEYYWILNHYDTDLEIHENYQKRTIRNRAQILTANGVLTLSVPLVKGKTQTNIQKVKISYDTNWPKQHIGALTSAYQSSPYYEHYADRIYSLIASNWVYLHELNSACMNLMEELNLVNSYNHTQLYNLEGEKYTLDMRSMKAQWQKAFSEYNQVFEAKYGYVDNLSILDAIFNLGPEVARLLRRQ